MIDVKGTRTNSAPAPDAGDPLGLQQTEPDSGKRYSAWFVGLIAVGLYIRSFLWPEPEPELEPAATPNSGGDGESGGSIRKASFDLGPGEDDVAPDTDLIDEDTAPDEAAPFPTVLGPFDSLFFTAAQTFYVTSGIQADSANTLLPPFRAPDATGIGSNGNGYVPGTPPSGGGSGGSSSGGGATETAEPEDNGEETDAPSEDAQRNRPPRNTGPVYLADVGSGAAVGFALSFFLSQTTDPEGAEMTVRINAVSSGEMSPRGDDMRYIADTDYLGEVRIDYTVSDGSLEISQTAFLNVVENILIGSDEDDLLVGTHGRDMIDGLAGDDNLAGLAGRDRIFGRDGDDNISGGDGDDILFGGNGNDLIVGGAGNDWISGGAGDDRIFGGDGDDEIYGDAGDDMADGGAGNDVIHMGEGDDTALGGDGDDLLSGGSGADLIRGDDGQDIIHAGEGDDIAIGGDGDDEIYGDAGDDMADGGAGNDVIHMGEGDDTAIGGLADDVILGEAGKDQLLGGEGDDMLSGGADADLLHGDAGDDVLHGGTGDDTAFGGDGEDILFGEAGNDHLDGGHGDDVISGDDGDDLLEGGAGNDVLSGGAGSDSVSGGAGDDLVIADDDCVSDVFDGGEGHDQLDYSAATSAVIFDLTQGIVHGESTGEDQFENFEHFVGSREGDTFYVGAGSGTLTGNGGENRYDFVQGDTVDVLHSIYRITDFSSDDDIWIGEGSSRYHIRKAQKSLEDRIEDGFEEYAEGTGADEPRLSFHFDWTEDYRRTTIEVDFDRDTVVDLELMLEGEHLFVVEHA
ncbi:Ca2+-binding protein, RTX toxin-related [Roseovarius nanhaiticus]|uniref:Ca2+-binding protein, RTX toxin-related n=1 Tax=Roseovarius nanhaiticus TaxID=573024 RepID=A0A1N7HLP5_9RHOB|nr:calcium-binding protein [Roseovarius nanhaiticus]SEL28757.1 Ca2+-binding protein, RTX toxin-related [Roseovarius nanhaiticus]SIS25776.1 Ca2+-binding protein, RTX toxin-related [Roseovarius nanhaiticus]